MQTAPFRDVADVLRRKYERAVHVTYEEGADKLSVGNSVTAANSNKITQIPPEELVYLEESPNYCKPDIIPGKKILHAYHLFTA